MLLGASSNAALLILAISISSPQGLQSKVSISRMARRIMTDSRSHSIGSIMISFVMPLT
jgi:hypothetical protein